MSTPLFILVYALIGLPVCFVTLVLARLFDFHEDNRIISAVLSFIVWPAAIAAQLLVLVIAFGIMPFINKFDGWSAQLANKLK